MKRPVEDGFSLLVGAGLGAALMYLFDPDRGQSRRKAVRQSAQSTLDSTVSGAGHVRDAASDLVDRAHGFIKDHVNYAELQSAGAAATTAAKNLYEHLSGQAGKSADDATSQIRDTLEQLTKGARKSYNQVRNRVGTATEQETNHHYVAQTTCAISSLAVGAGLVYFLDPNNGADRRASVLRCGNSALQETTEFFRRIGQFFSRSSTSRSTGEAPETSQPAEPSSAQSGDGSGNAPADVAPSSVATF